MRVVLLEPEIHFNTGNIGRTCVGTGTELHLVGRLGFSLDCAQIRRSGLDYWPKLSLHRHEDWDAFLRSLPREPSLLFFSSEARRSYWEAPYETGSCLVFGRESVGLPPELRKRYREKLYRIPHSDRIRSLNVSSAAAVVVYEALRRTTGGSYDGGVGEEKAPSLPDRDR